MSELMNSSEYQSFRQSIPRISICVEGNAEKGTWKIFDAGPRDVRCPIVCLPPASGTADAFFKQVMSLSNDGYRVIALEYPIIWKMKDWVEGFIKLLDELNLDKVHIFGASLGSFLAQKFAELTVKTPRVASLVLCNAFTDTSIFQQTASAPTFWMMPGLVLKKIIMGSFDKGVVSTSIADSIDFMVETLESISQKELASRLTMNCMNAYVEPQKLSEMPITLIDVYDASALSQSVKEEVYKCYPNAKRASLKTGGNFPYLSRADEVNMHLRIHLRSFLNTRYSPRLDNEEDYL
ncbi:hypothetical protein CAPTEDRAFT_228609 [Capitella teleta]|uniref:Maspardin n=1 Tax=Capitella teleta TaxID=283909 RepID=R7TZY6_CAPTE|nr:hypothetical protein CAPTEDRAFT_228609 [Capitella teleta]|eukprot:ELT96510.1 hypothetical protein CAPTEDRAFT_228609 [Capitella teleta]